MVTSLAPDNHPRKESRGSKAFVYVDCAVGGANRRNNVVRLEDYSPKGEVDCYATFLRFPEKLRTWAKSNGGSVKGYRGSAKATFFPGDFDCKGDLATVLDDLRRTLRRWEAAWDVPLDGLRVYFSGHKGFSVEIPEELFGGFEPGRDVADRLKALAGELLADSPTADTGIYDTTRLWRTPNTKNAKSGLYKVPLQTHEWLNLPPEEIKRLARKKREVVFTDPEEFGPVPALVDLWASTEGLLRAEPKPKRSSGPLGRSRSRSSTPDDGEPIHEGTRNVTLTGIAGRLHDGSRDLAQLEGDLQAVNQARCLPPLESAEVQGIARSIHRLAPCRVRAGRPSPEVIGLLREKLRDWWEEDWRGPGGKSERDVLLVDILFAIERGTILPCGGILVDVSHHQVAERARKSSSTAHAAHKRLALKGHCRGGGNGPNRREDQPSGIVLLPRPHERRKVEHPLPGWPPLDGVFDFALPTARRGRHSAPGLVRVASASRIAVVDHLERIGGWASERAIADALGISRAYDARTRYLEPLEAAAVVERSSKLWRLAEDWEEALERVFEEEEELERLLYSGRTADERQKERRVESGKRWRNRDNSHPEPAPSEEEMRELREGYPARRKGAIEVALACLFAEKPEFRFRRVGQIACALPDHLGPDFPRGPDGLPKDAEVEKILDGVSRRAS